MAVLFISHSSKDDAVVGALETWLKANGFTDLFIDHDNIAGGDKWREALRAAAHSCRVVICLVTPDWLKSAECFGEFNAAWYMGKRIIPLFLLPAGRKLGAEADNRLDRVCGEDQGLDLQPCIRSRGKIDIELDASVAGRLRTGLKAAGAIVKVGLDPAAFEIDRALRPTPFPGLSAFDDNDADAAIFYGRSREIAHTLEELRKMRVERDLRPLVILGASGAGKSSLLRAGIIPRLRRETPAWLPLRAFRPGADPLLNFAEALTRTHADFGNGEAHGIVRDRLFKEWEDAERDPKKTLTTDGLARIEAALEAEGASLRSIANRPGASILISVDQAEELARSDDRSGEALADYLRVALASTASDWQLAFTIRTDSFPELQRHRRFQDLEARGYDLRALPVFRFVNVVEMPARRYGAEVDLDLVDALMEDAPKEDALPLLAFATQRLWKLYGDSGRLTKDNYDKLGRLAGLIENAAERALRGIEPEQDVPLPAGGPSNHVEQLGAATFVPPLAQINDEGVIIRRIADWTGFSRDQQDLLRRFDRWRLVVTRGVAADNGNSGSDEGTVEVAHEALFREWGRLKAWLEPERARLEALRSLAAAAAAWDRQGRRQDDLAHRRKRLAEARELAKSERFAPRLGDVERDYLSAALRRSRLANAAIGLLGLALAAVGAGWWQQDFLKERYVWHMKMGPAVNEQPDEAFEDCANGCPFMVVVPAGQFMMGSPEGEGDSDEQPQHGVTIPGAFAASKYEVTFDEWDACVDAGACIDSGDSNWGRGNRPVINVSWDDAQGYAGWLSRMTGQDYRLLTEAEWEYAARAGSQTRYSWGDEIGEKNANCDGCGSEWDNRQTAPVGRFEPNDFGLHDMHGNVWEWTQDCWNGSYAGGPDDGTARTTGDCGRRVVRGGSWSYGPEFLRAAYRFRVSAVLRDYILGFRLARTLNP